MPKRKSRGSLTTEVPVQDEGPHPERLEVPAQGLHEGDGAVPAARAADRDREVGLALAAVEREEEAHEVLEPPPELAALRVAPHEFRDGGVPPVQRAQGG